MVTGKSIHHRLTPIPLPCPARSRKDHLLETFHLSSDGCRVETLSLRLPASISGPLPSPWLLREDYLSEKTISTGHSWAAQINPKIEDVPFRTCFRLEAPGAEKTAWGLAFFLQANDDRSLLVPEKEVRQTKSRALTEEPGPKRSSGEAKSHNFYRTNRSPHQPPSRV